MEWDEAWAQSSARSVNLIALDDSLQDLTKLNPRHSQIVELRFFGGLGFEEIGAVLDISSRTAEREWRTARAWLRRVIFPDESASERE